MMMPQPSGNEYPRRAGTEALRLAQLARATGYGDAPDIALQRSRDALALLDEELTSLHADVLRWQGTVLRDRGRTSEAEPLYRRSLQIASELRYDAGVAHALNCLAGLAQRRGDLRTATKMLTHAHVLADRVGDQMLMTMIQSNLGIISDIRGNTVAAIAHFRVALRVAESMEDDQQIVRVLINFGVLLIKQRRYEEADRALRRGLAIARRRGDLHYEGLFEENRADLHLTVGEIEEAFPAIRRALEIADKRDDQLRKAAALKLRGAYERMVGRANDATDTLRSALTLSAVGEDALLGAEILYQFGLALYDANDTSMAREVWNTALDAFERIAAPEWIARVRERIATGSTNDYT
jgi:tetratricopeptide (TPR) repeat protein